jgi:hypothetical protein
MTKYTRTFIPCACGCDELVKTPNRHGIPVKFKPLHHNNLIKKKRELIPCRCGCGELITNYNTNGKQILFKYGHQSRGKFSPRWQGGKTYTTKGYIKVLCKEHPNCDSKGYVLEHRLVMEQKLGRYLDKDEDIHHINGVKIDNRVENLELLSHIQHLSKRKKDMSDRFCSMCGRNKTYIDKKGYAYWSRDKNTKLFICSSCRHRI